MQSASKKHEVKAVKEARAKEEERLRVGDISDYKPKELTAKGRYIYRALVASLPQESLAKADGYTVETLADALDKMRECRQRIAGEGMIVWATNGNGVEVKKPNDHIAIYQRYAELAKKYMVELGLTPSARGKIASDAAQAAAKPKSLREMLAEDEDEEE